VARRSPDGAAEPTPVDIVNSLGDSATETRLDITDLDVILLRLNPFAMRNWAEAAGMDFARLASERGVLVLNDPRALAEASDKLYLQTFPEDVRPRTLVTRNRRQIEQFLEREGVAVLKPLRGYGGRSVFRVTWEDRLNLGQILRSIARDGYVIAQEWLPAADKGDTRLYLLDGKPLERDGRIAVVQRTRAPGDVRSNVHAGGGVARARMTDELARIAERVGPRLAADGMFFVGLDVAGDRLLEINVFSPGGLATVEAFEKRDFTKGIVEALEARVDARPARPSGSPQSPEIAT
jgi:glutathione synthase